jgi:UDP-N-acetylglucosamine 4,6-dehydratase/5-epimerase
LAYESILVTGGTGSFGKAFVKRVLELGMFKRIIIYSRDELKQFEMEQLDFIQENRNKVRFFIGDVRDAERLRIAMEEVDVVIHAAALKQVPAAEYNPFEAIKTNVMGAQNVIDACRANGVKRVVALSTDKAAAPINLYGATKLCSDKLFVAANNYVGKRDLRLCVVRYGNVMGSRGSVIPFFKAKANDEFLPITDERMTRFSITLEKGVDMVLESLACTWGGEIFIPKIPSYRITDVAEAVAPGVPHKMVGIRPGEKLHEEMITTTDALSTVEFERYYTILPSTRLWDEEEFIAKSDSTPGKRVAHDFHYESGTNPEFLTVDELRELIDTHVPG